MRGKEYAEIYIDAVLGEYIPSNELTRLAVERHLSDLKESKKKSYPYYFDEAKASAVIEAFLNFKFTIGKWRGRQFALMPFQAFILWCAYGWIRKDNNTRRFRKCYIKMPRKNGKTELLAGIGAYMYGLDGEKDPQIFWFATKKDQAKIGWDRQKELIEMLRPQYSYWRNYCDTSKYRIYNKSGLGYVAYLGRDSKTEDGTAPHCGIGDEYHAHPTDDMINVIEDGMGSRSQPMMWLITTAGYNPFSPCAIFEKTCEQILRGQIDGDNIFAIMFGIDEGDDWEDPEVWRKANPAYDYIDTLPGFLQSQYELAKTQGGSKLTSFLTKNMNVWTSTHSTWITDDIYQSRRKVRDIKELKGKICIGALDLSAKRDLTALSLFFPVQNGLEKPYLLRFAWVPEEEAKSRQSKDGIPYERWAKDGHIFLTPGNVIDYDYIYQTITGLYDTKLSRANEEKLYNGEGLMNLFKIDRIAYDRWKEEQIVSKLIDSGAKMAPFGQGFRSMSVPVDELEVMFAKGLIEHDGNQAARWCYSNVAMAKDPAGNQKPDKAKSNEKIDLLVTDVMAFGEWIGNQKNEKGTIEIFSMGKRWHS